MQFGFDLVQDKRYLLNYIHQGFNPLLNRRQVLHNPTLSLLHI